jgi:PIN domain
MFRMLIDTCVWLDLAKDPKQHPVLGVVEQMVREKMIALVVPRVVVDEFRRNRERIAKESAKSLSTHFRLVKDAVGKAGGNKRKTKTVLSHLDDVDHKVPIVGGGASHVLDRIERLLAGVPALETSDSVKLRAAQRAIDHRAPFHHDKNSIADALIIEMYDECVRLKTSTSMRFAFVTHNKHDFSLEDGSHKLPHADLAGMFSRVKSLYFINLAEALRRVDPSFVTDVMFEYFFDQEPRGLHEILKAEDLLFHQVWYNRHWNMRAKIENGTIKIVDEATYPQKPDEPETITRDTLKLAIRAAKRTEREYGKKNLGPWDDFEWGMINGKLSALRWALGDEWDMLDT